MACRPPFSRHGRPDERREPDPNALAHAADFAAATYGWPPDFLEAGLTDEQLLFYFDAAQDRLERLATTEFEGAIEAVRVGTVFAHDVKQYTRWRNRRKAATGRSRGMVGAELEAAVGRLASLFPKNVIREPAA